MLKVLAPTMEVELGDGKKYELVFDLNTFSAYEESTKKSFFDTLAEMVEQLQSLPKNEQGQVDLSKVSGLALFRAVRITDLQALVWAACHTYDHRDNPVWPFTRNQMGRLIHFGNVMGVAMAFLSGNFANYPTAEERAAAEVGEAAGAAETVETDPSAPIKVAPIDGGGGGTPSGQ